MEMKAATISIRKRVKTPLNTPVINAWVNATSLVTLAVATPEKRPAAS